MNTLTIPAFSAEAAEAAQRRLDNLAKVPRSLGRIEELAVRLAGITGKECPAFPEKSVVLFAADHDIALQGVSATGQEVTEMQVRNFVKGGGTINAFCRNAGARLSVVDIGVKNDLDDVEGLVRRKVMHAARDFSEGPAMTREEAERAILTGVELVGELKEQGYRLLATGEMGIGNTTTSSAVVSVLLRQEPADVTGRGAGLSTEGLRLKIRAIETAIAVNRPDPADGLDVLHKVGGLDIAGLAGVFLGGAYHHIPVLVDGFISSAAALVAASLCPAVKDYMLGSHASNEPAGKLVLEALGLTPFLYAGMCLGEGTGAGAVMPLLDMGLAGYREMCTFEATNIEAYQPLT